MDPQDVLSQHQPVVAQTLDAVLENVDAKGYRESRAPQFATLSEGESDFVSVTFPVGDHFIYAVCDGDCTDLDLALLDSSNQDVFQADEEDDDHPMISFVNDTAGEYRVRVTMAACNAVPCVYGIGFAQRQ
jgi:hypothetical protein